MKRTDLLSPVSSCPDTPGSGLPRLWMALADIPQLAKSKPGTELGTVICAVRPDAAFFRLSPESAQRLRQEISHRLEELLRADDRLYATESWEWLIVMPGLRSSATLTMAMFKIEETLSHRDLSVDGIHLRLPVWCGASIFPDDGEDPLYVVQSARIACLHAERHETRGALYDPQMEELDQRLKEFDVELKSAFTAESALQLFLQPQICARTGRCVGAEALLRWRRGNGEWVPPPELLAAIDRLGFRPKFNRWLFLAAARICDTLLRADISIRLSINVSANDLLDHDVPEMILQAMDTWRVPPQMLRLEITETNMVQEGQSVADVLKHFRHLGIGLSIDDFGTGFSGMSRLKNLPVDEIKIDQSFIRNVTRSRRDMDITESIIRLAHRLKIAVVAEGVEDPETASLLAQMECNWLQGYLFSHPVPLEQFCAWFREAGEFPGLAAIQAGTPPGTASTPNTV